MSDRRPDEPWSEADHAILEARTRALAAPVQAVEATSTLDVLILRVSGERYALPAAAVRAVAALARLTPLPHAPPEVAGLTVRSGAIVPVFSLRAVLGLALGALPEYGRVVILGEGNAELALIVDAVEEIRSADPAKIRPAPPTLTASAGPLIRGVDEQGVPLLDPDALLASDRLFIDIVPPAP